MTVPVRLDVVVKVKEREEERRLDVLSKTLRSATAARAALAQAQAVAGREGPKRGSAADFMNYEVARVQALKQVEQARQKLNEALRAVDTSRTEWTAAHRGAEAVRRVADARRSELVESRNRAEQKALDELALLQFGRTG